MTHKKRILALYDYAIQNNLIPSGQHIVAWTLDSNADRYILLTANAGEVYPFRGKINEIKNP